MMLVLCPGHLMIRLACCSTWECVQARHSKQELCVMYTWASGECKSPVMISVWLRQYQEGPGVAGGEHVAYQQPCERTRVRILSRKFFHIDKESRSQFLKMVCTVAECCNK